LSSNVFGNDGEGLFHEFEMFRNISKPKTNWSKMVTQKQGLFKVDDILGSISKFKYFKIQDIPEKVEKQRKQGLYSFQIIITLLQNLVQEDGGPKEMLKKDNKKEIMDVISFDSSSEKIKKSSSSDDSSSGKSKKK